MEQGGIRNEGEDKLFLISTTHGAETIGLAAMIATIKEFNLHNMIDSNWKRGEWLREQVDAVIERYGLGEYLQLVGYACLMALVCKDKSGTPNDDYRTLMLQEMIARGVLFQGLFYTTWSHQQAELEHIVTAFEESCMVYRNAIDAGSCDGLLIGKAVKPVFRKKI
jgi:glutamate-1-semialdehyde 2,1-aminomutase